jgi:hypothetical protein
VTLAGRLVFRRSGEIAGSGTTVGTSSARITGRPTFPLADVGHIL